MQIEPYIAAHPSKPGSLIVSGAEVIPGISGVHVDALTQGLGNQPREPLVLAENSLLIPYADFPTRVTQVLTASGIYVIRSENGGASFDTPHFVTDMPGSFPGGGVGFATDLSNGKFRGRIYAVWDSGDFGIESPFHPGARSEAEIDSYLRSLGFLRKEQIDAGAGPAITLADFLNKIQSGELSYLSPSIETLE
jgi:hypothetical protein